MTLKQWKGVSINKFTREDLVDALEETVTVNERETQLRDEFAMEAFKAVMAVRPEHYSTAGKEVREDLAQDIWALADAMVKAGTVT